MSIDIGRRVAKHDYGDLFAPYTGVTINLQDGDTSFTAGDDSGRTLTVESPWASQKMADNLLAQVRGARHQPFNATGAILDPAAELGDAITVDGVTGIMYRRSQRFGTLYRSDISAPGDEEINHEIPYYPPVKRALNRVGGVARGAAGAAATSLKRQDGIEEDFKVLEARVTDVAAGMEAYVRNETFDNYKLAVSRLFAEVDENGKKIKSELQLQATSIDGLQTAQSELADRVGSAESSLKQKAESKTVTDLAGRVAVVETSESELASRVKNAESELTLKANGKDVEALEDRVTETESATADLTTRVGDTETSLSQKAESKTVTDLAGRVTTVETSQSELTSRVGETEASLKLKAESSTVTALGDKVASVESATSSLSTRVGDAEASLQLKASQQTVTDLDGKVNTVSTSIAELNAEVIKLQGRVDVTGSLSVSDGNIRTEGNLHVHGVTYLDNGYFFLGGAKYLSDTITTVTSFTQALGEQAPTKKVTLLASIVKTETTVDALPGETVSFAA